MSAIGKGDWVECVDDTPENGKPYRDCDLDVWLTKGRIYLVTDVFPGPRSRLPCVALAGAERQPWRGMRIGWHVRRFRPIYRPRADLIESLLAPLPEHVLEQA